MCDCDAPFCTIGAETAPTSADAGRDPRTGKFARGNRAAVVTGSRSVQFWQAAEAALEEMTVAILADRGCAYADAPVALRLAARGAAQAVLIREAAFARMTESGGPLSGSDRERGAHKIWAAASDRVLRHTQAIGYERKTTELPTIASYLASKRDGAA